MQIIYSTTLLALFLRFVAQPSHATAHQRREARAVFVSLRCIERRRPLSGTLTPSQSRPDE